MTANETTTETTATPNWDAISSKLEPRFPGIKDSVLCCIHCLETDPAMALDEMKERANQFGLRVTAASANSARRLLDEKPAKTNRAPRGVKPEGLIKSIAAQIERHRNGEVERLKNALRKSIQMLQAALDS
ncbi:MAG: hypothetical protein KAI24_24615 [Planctomycetes bacterium]|nr:hypothetical protein [Planctomycetota bacterium]